MTLITAAKSLIGPTPRLGGVVCDDMARLLPSFRAQIDGLCGDMSLAGHDARVFETWRSPERVAFLAAKGTGSLHSMHPYGIAADIIDRVKLWGASGAFWRDLTRLAEARGLTSGARFSRLHDLPHLQGIPVSAQESFRRLPDDAARDAFAATFYGKRLVA